MKSNVTRILCTFSCVTGNSFGDDRHNSVAILRELCTDATSEQILQSLNRHNGDANIAAQELLDMSQHTLGHSKDCQIHCANQLYRLPKCHNVLIP